MIDLKTRRIMAVDLSKHLDERVETVLHDFMDRCEDIGAEEAHATSLALTVLAHYTAMAALGLGASENDFLTLCRWAYGQAKKKVPLGGVSSGTA